MSSNINLDSKQVKELLNDLSGKEIKKAQKQGLKKSASILVKETKRQLKKDIPKASKKGNKKSPYKDTLLSAVRSSIKEDTNKNPYAKVHIMGIKKKGSGTFRAKFFEKGTKKRFTYSRKLVETNRNLVPEYIHSKKTGKLIKNKAWYKRAKNDYKVSRTQKANRGIIKPRWFFKRAQAISENEVFDNLENNLLEAIVKINKKHNGK